VLRVDFYQIKLNIANKIINNLINFKKYVIFKIILFIYFLADGCISASKSAPSAGPLPGHWLWIALSVSDLQKYLLASPTAGAGEEMPLIHIAFLDQNRVGIFTLLGFCAFHSLAMLYAQCLHWATGR
jgi:hypothetical protein